MLSLGALDFGVIVDGAIVVTENILRRRESKPTEELTEADVRSATGQVARPIFFATLIIITAYFPLFTLQRGEAALFTPMAYTVGFALFGALLCTLALVPGLAYLAFRKPRPAFRNKPLEWLGRSYRAALGGLLNRPIYFLCGDGTGVRWRRGSGRLGGARLSAGSRRGFALAPSPNAERSFA
jgi:cobalt-zinc-cadmium resistance protein CzcA